MWSDTKKSIRGSVSLKTAGACGEREKDSVTRKRKKTGLGADRARRIKATHV